MKNKKNTRDSEKYGKKFENFFKSEIQNSGIENYLLNQFEFLNFYETIDIIIQKTAFQLKTRDYSSSAISITSKNYDFKDLEKSKDFINNSLISFFFVDIQKKKDNKLETNFYMIPKPDLKVIIENNKLKFENKLISLIECKTKNRDSVFYQFRPNGETIDKFNKKYKNHLFDF